MKNRNSILTHAAVFVTGIALAAVISRSNPSASQQPAEGQGASHAGAQAAGGDSGEGGDGPVSLRRGRREAAARTARSTEAPVERLAAITRMGDPLERQTALMAMLEKLGPEEFAAVAEQFRQLDHYGGSGDEYDLIMRSWAKADPLAALAFTTAQGRDRGATALVLAAWAGKDAAAAEAWAVANHQGEGPNPYLTAVIRGVAAYDIDHATRLARLLPPGDEQRDAVDAITRALFVQGLDRAMEFPASIDDPKLRNSLVGEVARRLTYKDPAQAAGWLAAMKDSGDQRAAARRVGEALARQDVRTAATWLGQLQPEARAEAARGIIPRMSEGDISGTARWVSTLAGIPNYDRVVEEYVWSCDYRAPEQSAAWIQGVADPERQTRLYHQMLGEWAKRDAAAVGNWVAANQVPASVARRFKR